MAKRAGKNAVKAASTTGQATRAIVRPDPTTTAGPRVVGIRVRATQLGYYDHTRRRIGDVFTVVNEQAFSTRWMERVDPSTPEKITLPNEALKQQHDEILGAKQRASVEGMHVGPDDVPADVRQGIDNPLGAD
jgi:hypothetical protein